MNATEVIGLVMLAMRNSEVSSIAASLPSRAAPWLEKWTVSPSRVSCNWAWGRSPVVR